MVLPTTWVPEALNQVPLVRKLVCRVNALASVSTFVDETNMPKKEKSNKTKVRFFLNINNKIMEL
jgi:hypothetical protein